VPIAFDPVPRYVRNGRDLSEFVHGCQSGCPDTPDGALSASAFDAAFFAGLNAGLMLLGSQAVAAVVAAYGSALLPQAYPEGYPSHLAYPSGHVTFAGAMVTMLKAFFKGAFPIPQPQVATDDGLALVAYPGTLTVYLWLSARLDTQRPDHRAHPVGRHPPSVEVPRQRVWVWASGLQGGTALRRLDERLEISEGLQGAIEFVNAILDEG
jgi:hypothetical protein